MISFPTGTLKASTGTEKQMSSFPTGTLTASAGSEEPISSFSARTCYQNVLKSPDRLHHTLHIFFRAFCLGK
jgi:hypothetical protein